MSDARVRRHMKEGRSKAASVLMAVSVGYWTWLGTCIRDAMKLWVSLVIGSRAMMLVFIELSEFRQSSVVLAANIGDSDGDLASGNCWRGSQVKQVV